MKKTIALIGHPVVHSISPAFQQAAFDALGLDIHYEAWDVPDIELPEALERLRSNSLLGANVTIPHKVTTLRFLDHFDGAVELVGAVNTIVNRDGQLYAMNTDVEGILNVLNSIDVDLKGTDVLILGAGGAARAAVVAMRMIGVARVTIANRTAARAEQLVKLGGTELTVQTCQLDGIRGEFQSLVSGARVIIQATSLGMNHGPDETANLVPSHLMNPDQLAFDLVYTPERTPFLRAADDVGATTISGLAMLVYQGAAAFRHWTGQEPPISVMFDAARTALDSKVNASDTEMR